jgi:hypothetical protein
LTGPENSLAPAVRKTQIFNVVFLTRHRTASSA